MITFRGNRLIHHDRSAVVTQVLCVSSVLKENYNFIAGRAAFYSIEGGDVQGMFYTPPELNGK